MLDNWYSNIGGKIKELAKWCFIVDAIGAVITGLILLIDWGFEDAWWALFIILFGPVVAFVASWILYAFGQLIEDVHEIRPKSSNTSETKTVEKAASVSFMLPKKAQKESQASKVEAERTLPYTSLDKLQTLIKEMRTQDLEALLREEKSAYSKEELKAIRAELTYRFG